MIDEKYKQWIINRVKRRMPNISVDDIRSELELRLMDPDHKARHVYCDLLDVFGSRAWQNSTRGMVPHYSLEKLAEDCECGSPEREFKTRHPEYKVPECRSFEDSAVTKLDAEIMREIISHLQEKDKQFATDLINGVRLTDIAEAESVSVSAISHRKAKIFELLREASGQEHYFEL